MRTGNFREILLTVFVGLGATAVAQEAVVVTVDTVAVAAANVSATPASTDGLVEMSTAWVPSKGARKNAESMPSAWVYDEHFSQTLPTDDRWWSNFNDTMLDSLIAIGMEYNYNAVMAYKRINLARRELQMTQSAYYPTLTATAGWTASGQSGNIVSPGTKNSNSSFFNLGVSMNWEIDVFGRINRRAEQKKAMINLSKAEYAAVQVSLASEIASAYITLRTYQAQLAVAKAHIASQKHIVEMTEARKEAGLASMLEVSQAKLVLNSTQASIPSLEAAIETVINSISVLVGEFPDQMDLGLRTPRALPSEFQMVGVGVPGELVRRRPDIIEAECQLAADAAAIGIAKKDFLPTLSLTGSIGAQSHNIGDLFENHSLTYSVAPQLSWTIFSGMSRKYSVEQARESMEIDIDNYNMTLQTAVQEVDNAIITYAGTLRNIALLEETVKESERTLELSVDLYRSSLSSFTNVVDAQMNVLTYENSLVAARGKALQSLVNLYKALGGGWIVVAK